MSRRLYIVVFCLHNNGVRTFTYHLAKAMEMINVDVHIFKVHHGNEGRMRKYAGDLMYENACLSRVLRTIKHFPAICTTPDKSKEAEMYELVKAGCKMMVHGTFELDWNLPLGKKPVIIRKKIGDHVDGTYVPHPYVRVFKPNQKFRKTFMGAAISRIDMKKGSHVVIDAIVNHGADIHLYGELMPFIGMHLDKKYKGWRKHWRGKFLNTFGADILSDYQYLVDMSMSKQDGGGSQYTILEAMDAGATPVINSHWSGGDLVHGENCIVMDDLSRFSYLKKKAKRKSMEQYLMRHNPKAVATTYMKKVFK